MENRIITITREKKGTSVIVRSVAQMNALARRMLKGVHGGDVLALSGELGAGKTTFVQGLAKAARIAEQITSPTFVLMKIYALPQSVNNIEQLCHIDAYRLESGADLAAIGAQEYIGDARTLTVIEWPERVKELIPRMAIQVSFDYTMSSP